MTSITSDRPAEPARTLRVERIRHELRRREVRVRDVERLGAGVVAVTFDGDALADFRSDSFDDHVKFMYADAAGEWIRRDLTPRRFDRAACTLTIEFALHDGGRVADWARTARPGQTAAIGGPRGSMVVPTGYDWHLLAGDMTALPAIRRRLEELPATTRAIVIAQVADERDRLLPASAADVAVRWVSTGEALVQSVATLERLPGDGYAWCACEASVAARLRRVLLEDRGHPRDAARIAAYWKQGSEAHHEVLSD